jgi:hypothetical protein
MKRILIQTLTILLLASCGSKESDPTPSIVGTWVQTTQEGTQCTDPADNWKFRCPPEGPCYEYIFIADDNKFTLTNAGLDPVNPIFTGTYSINGDKLILADSTADIPYAEEYTLALTSTTLTLIREPLPNGCVQSDTYLRQE